MFVFGFSDTLSKEVFLEIHFYIISIFIVKKIINGNISNDFNMPNKSCNTDIK